jgi:hypothetical protein
LFDLAFGWKFKNLNTSRQNFAGIDLIDTGNKIVAQVSSTTTKQKVESALTKDLSNYQGYSFKFISISKNAKALRTKTFTNPYNLQFSPCDDIIDIPMLLSKILEMDTDHQKKIYEFLLKELKSEPDPEKVESNLTTIINILSKEDWKHGIYDFETVPYNIEEKMSYNKLDTARILVDDYKIHYHRIQKIYSDFDKLGANKSLSILDGLRSEYLALGSVTSPDQRFLSIVEKVAEKIRMSANYMSIAEEELNLCVQILVVDAFIRCKIFKNPMESTDVSS